MTDTRSGEECEIVWRLRPYASLLEEVRGVFRVAARETALEEVARSIESGVVAAAAVLVALGLPIVPFVSFASKLVAGLGELVLDRLARRKVDVADYLINFLKLAREAAPRLGACENVVEEVASEWEMKPEEFKQFINNLASFVTTKLTSEEELEKLKSEVGERLERLRREVEETRRELGGIAPTVSVYFDEGEWPYVDDGETLFLKAGVVPGAKYVENTLEREILRRLASKVEGGIIVVKGGKGVGKSTAVAVALYRVLRGGIIHRGGVEKVAIVEVKPPLDTNTVAKIKAALTGRLPIFYLDPSRLGSYSIN